MLREMGSGKREKNEMKEKGAKKILFSRVLCLLKEFSRRREKRETHVWQEETKYRKGKINLPRPADANDIQKSSFLFRFLLRRRYWICTAPGKNFFHF